MNGGSFLRADVLSRRNRDGGGGACGDVATLTHRRTLEARSDAGLIARDSSALVGLN